MSFRHLLGDLSRDLRYGARVLIKNPLFSLVAVMSLALGIGGAASVFTVLNAVILRDLPVPNPQQLFSAQKFAPGRQFLYYSWPSFTQVRKDLEGRAEVTAYTNPNGMQVRPDAAAAAADRSIVQLVSGEFFQVFRQRPQIGRLLQPDDNVQLGAHPVAVISDAFWERHFARAPSVLGRQMVINGTNFAIVGVAAREFFGPIVAVRNPDVWVPLMMQSAIRYSANASTASPADPRQPWPPQELIEWLNVFVRVPDGATASVAAIMSSQYQRESTSRLDRGDTEGPARIAQQRVNLEPASRGTSRLRTDLTTPLYVLLGMVGVLLVIASGNLASLLLSRANARERELAIRLSIGAGRARIVRQLLVETLLLASVGGILGLLLAAWGKDALLAMFATGSTTIDLDTGFDWRVLAFCVLTTAAAGLLAGIGPALRTSRVPLAESLKSQSRAVGSTARSALVGKSLVAAQIAFCLLLLVLAALFTRSMQSLLKIDVGYDRDAILVARVDVRSIGLPSDRRQALYDRIVERLRTIPGVQSASLSMMGPFGNGQRTSSLTVEGYTPQRGETLLTNEEAVTDTYFDTVGLRIVAGRNFEPSDRKAARSSTIINETMAKRFFPQGDAIGKRWNYGDAVDAESPVIVGVVEDARYTDLRGATPFMVYQLAAARQDEILSSLEVRAAMEPSQIIPAVRKALTELEPGLPVFDMIPLTQRYVRGISNERLVANLTMTFSAMALLLACLGLYGTISYGVTRRVTELGVRMALGAARRDVLLLVIREASLLVAAGALVGIPLPILASRGVSSLLYGIGTFDPVSYGIAVLALVAVSGFASFLPAFRASRIDPMVALRKD